MILGLVGLTACRELTLTTDRVIALEVADPAPKVEEADTLRLAARPLNAAGTVVSGAVVTWAALDTGRLAFALDPSGLVTGAFPGSGRVQAQVENLRSDPVTVTVTALPDTAAAASFTRVALAPADIQSAPLAVTVYDRGAQGQLSGLGSKPVTYQVVQPASGSPGFFLTVKDTVPGPDPRRVTTLTDLAGRASAVARRLPGQTPPDSAIVEATATTARGAAVAGTPVRFVVVFRSS